MKQLPVALLALTTACAVTEETFAESYGDAWCGQARTCNRGYYESEYKDMHDCRNDVANDIESLMELPDSLDCTFDEEEAGNCLSAIRSASCSEFYENDYRSDCQDIYDCIW